MTIRLMLVSLCVVGGVSGPAFGQDADVIKSAESAAPAALAAGEPRSMASTKAG